MNLKIRKDSWNFHFADRTERDGEWQAGSYGLWLRSMLSGWLHGLLLAESEQAQDKQKHQTSHVDLGRDTACYLRNGAFLVLGLTYELYKYVVLKRWMLSQMLRQLPICYRYVINSIVSELHLRSFQANNGEILISITYLQKVQRLTINMFKARNLIQEAHCSDSIGEQQLCSPYIGYKYPCELSLQMF